MRQPIETIAMRIDKFHACFSTNNRRLTLNEIYRKFTYFVEMWEVNLISGLKFLKTLMNWFSSSKGFE